MAGSKILLIDDDQDFVQLLEYDLKKHGYQVTPASNGEEGLDKLKTDKPELIILDIKMPKMDGYTFVRRVKKDSDTYSLNPGWVIQRSGTISASRPTPSRTFSSL